MTDTLKEVFSDGFAAPLGDVIAAIGRGVADAQAALDRASLEATLSVYDHDGDAGTALLRDIGYRPTFYVLPETTCEVQVSMRVGGSSAADGSANAAPGGPRLLQARSYVTPLDAGFANRFGYEASASAKLTFKIVAVPPPSALDDNRPVPALVGRPIAEAQAALATVEMEPTYQDQKGKPVASPAATAQVVAQSPAAMTLSRPGGSVALTIGP